MTNRANTAQGTKAEHLFAKSIFEHRQAFAAIIMSLGYGAAPLFEPRAEVIGGNRRKADVEIRFGDAAPPIRVSIKSFTGAGYNHLERRNLEVFCDRNQIKADDAKFLESLWLRKARNSRAGLLVAEAEKPRVRAIFSSIEPALSALLGNDHPQIMALYSVNESTWRLYDMNKQVLPLIRSQSVSFTKRSSNIEIGRYIVIQRKGSARGESGADVFSLDHGSNHIQVKMRVKRFWEEVEPISWYRL